MKGVTAVYLKEMRAYFFSPIAYVVLVGMAFLTGYIFSDMVYSYNRVSMMAMRNPYMQNLDLTRMVVSGILRVLALWIMTFVIPLLTMRLLSEEKKSGTLELLLSYPVTPGGVVLGKFLAGWSAFILMMLPCFIHLVILRSLAYLHMPAVMVGFLGAVLMSGAFVSLGLFASSLTENQIVAAITGFAGLLLLWLIGWADTLVGPALAPLLKAVSVGTHYQNFLNGILDTADIAYFLLFIGFFIFLSTQAVEAKRWKA